MSANHDVRRAFGRQLSHWRRQRNFTQKALGDKIGVGESTVAHYESGSNDPGIVVFRQICVALAVEADVLLGLKVLS